MAPPLGGAAGESSSTHHHCWRRRRWRPPWEVLWVGSAALTTVVKGDVDGRPPGRCCRRVWQHPPLLLEKTSMGGLRGVAGGSGSTHHHC
jgi:hypothetical protein